MYTEFKLDEHQREELLHLIQPTYNRVIAEHITLCLGKHVMQSINNVTAYGLVDDDGLQYLLCEVDGEKINPTSQRPYHVTWSIDSSRYKPKDTGIHAKEHWQHLQYQALNIPLKGNVNFY